MIRMDGPTDYVALLADEAIAYASKLLTDTVDLAHDIRRRNLATVTSLLEAITARHTYTTHTHHSNRPVAHRDESVSVKAPATDSQPHEENGKQEEIE